MRGQPLKGQRAALYIEQAARAIHTAHQHGILHRDVKPHNILIELKPLSPGERGRGEGPGRALVTDFGLAKLAQSPGVTRTGEVMGTPPYMSPEQAQSAERVTVASDVYSLGATLFALLTGRAPFRGDNVPAILRQVVEHEPPRPRALNPQLDRDLETICLKCLEKSPAKRYPSALALAEDLGRWQAGEPIQARRVGNLERAWRWCKRKPALAALIAAAFLLFVGGSAAAAIWYQQVQAEYQQVQAERWAEAEQQKALTDQRLRSRLEQARQVRSDLHKILDTEKGLARLLNDPAVWQAHIKTVRIELTEARLLQAAAGPIDESLAGQIDELERQLGQEEQHRQLALDLEKAREEHFLWVEGKFNTAGALKKYREAFRRAGLDLDKDAPEELARRIRQSPIRRQLVAALDDGANVAWEKEKALHERLLRTARLVDPDRWRDRLRDPKLWGDGATAELATELLDNAERLAELPPQTLSFMVFLLPHGSDIEERWLRQAYLLHPDDFWLAFELGSTLQVRKQPVEGTGFYRAALAVRPSSSAAWNNLGIALRDSKDLPAAIAAFRKALALDKQSAWIWNNLGIALADSKDLPGAIAAYHKALAIDENLAQPWNNLGSALHDSKDLPAAIAAYRKALVIDKQFAWAWYNLGNAHADNKDLPAAIDAYKQALAIDRQFAAAWNNLGLALAGSKDLPAAIDAYHKALGIDENLAQAWNNLGIALAGSKDLPAAIDAYKKALAIDKQNAAAWTNLGNVLRVGKDLPGAIAAYHKAIAIDKQHALAWNNLGLALYDSKNLPAAIDAYKKALAIHKQYAAGWTNLGLALYDSKNLPAAIDAYKKALAIDKHYAVAWFNLGNAHYASKDLAAAIDAFHKALAIDKHYAVAWFNLGVSLRERKDLAAAIDAYQKGLAIEKQDAKAWNHLGLALLDSQDLAAAIDAFRKGLAIDKHYAEAWNNLGIALAGSKNLPAAITAWHQALAIDKQNVKAWYNLGNAFRESKDLPAAIANYKNAIDLLPDYAEAHCNLGLALQDQGDFAAALKALQKGHDLGNRRPGWPYQKSAAWVKRCQQLLALEQRRVAVLDGEAASTGDLLALADMCSWYKKRYPDAVKLYATAFAQEPKVADILHSHRYNAACAAALAAGGKGNDSGKLNNQEKTNLRRQALDWLKSDLAAWQKLVDSGKPLVVMLAAESILPHWQSDADLAGVRDAKELAKLPKEEQQPWQQLWSDVNALVQKARGRYTQSTLKGRLTAEAKEQVHEVKLTASSTCVIDMQSKQFDTYLRLEDGKGAVLAENDDISKENLNSRIVFTPFTNGVYRLIATSYQQRGRGAYEITLREFAGKK